MQCPDANMRASKTDPSVCECHKADESGNCWNCQLMGFEFMVPNKGLMHKNVFFCIIHYTVHRPYRGQPYRGHFVIFRKNLHRPYRGHFKNDQLFDCFVSYGNVPTLLDFKSSHIDVTILQFCPLGMLFDKKTLSFF